ncbi:hypothetical protein M378DRAFT_164499, partial [Amanita muscaria Koide BX008]
MRHTFSNCPSDFPACSGRKNASHVNDFDRMLTNAACRTFSRSETPRQLWHGFNSGKYAGKNCAGIIEPAVHGLPGA